MNRHLATVVAWILIGLASGAAWCWLIAALWRLWRSL